VTTIDQLIKAMGNRVAACEDVIPRLEGERKTIMEKTAKIMKQILAECEEVKADLQSHIINVLDLTEGEMQEFIKKWSQVTDSVTQDVTKIFTRVDADTRISDALDVAFNLGAVDGLSHKAWVIDQMVRRLTRDDYDRWVEKWKDGSGTYEWDEGIAP